MNTTCSDNEIHEICLTFGWDISDTEHSHYLDEKFIADYNDDELKLFGNHGDYKKTYKIIQRLQNGKNIYKL